MIKTIIAAGAMLASIGAALAEEVPTPAVPPAPPAATAPAQPPQPTAAALLGQYMGRESAVRDSLIDALKFVTDLTPTVAAYNNQLSQVVSKLANECTYWATYSGHTCEAAK